MAWDGSDLKDYLVATPLHGQRHFPHDQVAQSHKKMVDFYQSIRGKTFTLAQGSVRAVMGAFPLHFVTSVLPTGRLISWLSLHPLFSQCLYAGSTIQKENQS